jgi:hypothetical protein
MHMESAGVAPASGMARSRCLDRRTVLKAQRTGHLFLFVDESDAYLLPGMVKTWANRVRRRFEPPYDERASVGDQRHVAGRSLVFPDSAFRL